jgi:hypothetical protein
MQTRQAEARRAMAISTSGPVRQPPRPATPCSSVRELARIQAVALLEYLAANADQLPYEVLADDIMATHEWLCDRCGWRPRPWQSVGAELRRMTGGRKVYRWFLRDDGAMHRLRVYPVPRAAPLASTLASTPTPTPVPAPAAQVAELTQAAA